MKVQSQETRFIFKAFSILAAALLVFGITHAQKYEGKFFNNVDANGVILDGYDAVAFFTDSKPVKVMHSSNSNMKMQFTISLRRTFGSFQSKSR